MHKRRASDGGAEVEPGPVAGDAHVDDHRRTAGSTDAPGAGLCVAAALAAAASVSAFGFGGDVVMGAHFSGDRCGCNGDICSWVPTWGGRIDIGLKEQL